MQVYSLLVLLVRLSGAFVKVVSDPALLQRWLRIPNGIVSSSLTGHTDVALWHGKSHASHRLDSHAAMPVVEVRRYCSVRESSQASCRSSLADRGPGKEASGLAPLHATPMTADNELFQEGWWC